jgi:excisionase family DNA binding protein
MENPISEYTVSEFAQLKGLSTMTVYRWIKKGIIKHKKIGKITIIITDKTPAGDKGSASS